jgi:DNA helicase-2/ATP-dependent DNA helicase PcrA
MLDFLSSHLNQSQLDAVLYNEGPSLVIAGAGSGKTRVLTYKIACLLDNGLPAESILALTFTNKAAREMKERIAMMVGWKTSRRLWMGTFHSVFSRILRAEAESLGFTSQFTIYDTSDSKSLVKTIVKEMGLDDKAYKSSSVQAKISYAKNNLISPQAYRANSDILESDRYAKIPQVFEIYNRYAWLLTRWISMIYYSIRIFYSAIFPIYLLSTKTSFNLFWWMSIRIPIFLSI